MKICIIVPIKHNSERVPGKIFVILMENHCFILY